MRFSLQILISRYCYLLLVVPEGREKLQKPLEQASIASSLFGKCTAYFRGLKVQKGVSCEFRRGLRRAFLQLFEDPGLECVQYFLVCLGIEGKSIWQHLCWRQWNEVEMQTPVPRTGGRGACWGDTGNLRLIRWHSFDPFTWCFFAQNLLCFSDLYLDLFLCLFPYLWLSCSVSSLLES